MTPSPTTPGQAHVGAGFAPARNVSPRTTVSIHGKSREAEEDQAAPGAYRDGHAFLLTISTRQRYPCFRLHPKPADFAVELLRSLGADRGSSLYAWCVMPDHAHLLVQDRDVVEFVRLFKGKMVSKALTREPERPLWQRSFYDHALRKEEALEDVARYVGENPVRCGLVGHPRAYYLVRVGSVA